MLSESEKAEQIEDMWEEHVHGGWWALYDYYHRLYRGVPWSTEALNEVDRAKTAAQANPQGRRAETNAPALPCLAMLLDR